MAMFGQWFLTGLLVWAGFAALVASAFWYFDKNHSIEGMLVTAIVTRTMVFIILFWWFGYGTYLLGAA
jgi:hypothetical protein